MIKAVHSARKLWLSCDNRVANLNLMYSHGGLEQNDHRGDGWMDGIDFLNDILLILKVLDPTRPTCNLTMHN